MCTSVPAVRRMAIGVSLALAALTTLPSMGEELPISEPIPIAGFGLDLFAEATAVDVNGDGATDAAYSFRDRDTGEYGIAWNESEFLGSNGPDPNTRWLIVEGNNDAYEALAAADFDGDGDQDMVSVEDDRVTLFANESGVGRTGDWEDFTASAARDGRIVAAADFDGDGDPDILARVERGVFDSTLGWIENQGRNDAGPVTIWTFVEHDIEPNEDIDVPIAEVADVDGDGDLDVIALIEIPLTPPLSEFRVVWYQNRVREGLSWLRSDIIGNNSIAQNVGAIALADLDGDGDNDLLTASQTFGQDVAWYANQGAGASWSSARIVDDTLGFNAFGFAIGTGDVDQDGDHDIMLGASGTASAHRVLWYDNEDGDGTAWAGYTLTEDGYNTNAVAIDDLDEDGDTDVLISYGGDESNTPRVAWFENQAIHRRAAYFDRRVVTSAANGAIAVAGADLDRDGDQDIVAVGRLDQAVEWYENDGTPGGAGDWTQRQVATAPEFPRAVDVADIDRDGDTDIAIVTSESGAIGGPGDLIWYENANGSGTSWTSRTVDDTLSFAGSVSAADIDNDGDMDLVTAIGSGLVINPGQVRWYENLDGAGASWTAHFVAAVTNSSPRISVGDIDGDGDTDIVVATFSDDTIKWFENEDATSWVTRTVTSVADGARSAWVSDLDGDGDNDVLSASANDDTVAWYENTNGDGSSFGARQVIDAAASEAFLVRAADLDGDGDNDVMAALPGADSIAWYENLEAGNFAPAQYATVSADGARGVAAADVDGNGLPDLLGASQDDDTVAWHPNVGGQLSLPTADTAPATIAGNGKDDVLRIVARHNGRAGDPDLDLEALHVRFLDGPGAPLTAPQFANLISSVDIYGDTDSSGDWGAPPDLPYNTVGPIFFPTGPAEGFVTFVGGLRLSAGESRTLFLVLGFDEDAYLQNPNTLRAVHLTANTSVGAYSDFELDVVVEGAPDTTSSAVTAIAVDTDGDGVADFQDNCTLVANSVQRDTDGDNIGNRCDPDIAIPNDCVVNVRDLAEIKIAYFSTPVDSNWNPDADLNGDNGVNATDLAIMKSLYFQVPGPSGLPNACDAR